jgi:hypothetical protein
MKTTNEELARAWVAKLRDPAVEQTKHALRVDNKLCALGALCDAAVDLGMGEWVQHSGWFVYQSKNGERSAQNWITDDLKRAFPQRDGRGYGLSVTYRDRLRQVYILNDSVGLPFSEIADLVEAEYL